MSHGAIEAFLQDSVALFVIMDPIGLVPIFDGMTKTMATDQKRRLFRVVTYTGGALLFMFALLGQQLLVLFGISLPSFMIAGGLLLLLLSMEILVRGERVQKIDPEEDPGVVPLAFPLLVGPGAITTMMVIIQSSGLVVALSSIVLVMSLTWIVLRLTDRIHSVLGRTGAAVVARVMAVFIAAIAIQYIVVGIRNTILLP